MMLVPSGVRVHIALGVSGHLFAFRGRKANLIKIVFWNWSAKLKHEEPASASKMKINRRIWIMLSRLMI